MDTTIFDETDAARTECTCAPCHGCPAVTRLNDVIDNLIAALATATGKDPQVTRLANLGRVTP